MLFQVQNFKFLLLLEANERKRRQQSTEHLKGKGNSVMDQQSGPCRSEIRSFLFLTTRAFKLGSGMLIEKALKTDDDLAADRISQNLLLTAIIKVIRKIWVLI